MMNIPNYKKLINAVPKNKKSGNAAVEHLRFPGVGKILTRQFARTCFLLSGDQRKVVRL